MFGSGVRIGIVVLTIVILQVRILMGLQEGLIACVEAVVGALTLCIVEFRVGSNIPQTFVKIILVSALLCNFVSHIDCHAMAD